MLLKEQETQAIVSGFVCDRCGKTVSKKDNILEHQEGHHISFIGGYESVFGDGATVECDLCQQCLKVLIQDFCRIYPSNS